MASLSRHWPRIAVTLIRVRISKQPTFTRCDLPLKIGDDLARAVEFNMALGPAAELIRLCGDEADKIRPKLEREIGEVLADFQGADGVSAPASTWIISATVPG